MSQFHKLLLQFYRPFWWYHLLFSIISLKMLTLFGVPTLPLCLSFKFSGYASAIFFRHYLSSYVYDYYRNAGHGVVKLYTITFSAELIVFLLFTSACLYLWPVHHA